jgi:NADH-quinone oxidoreductase subunit J
MVLFVFVIMLLNAGLEEHTSISKMAGFPGILLAIALTGFIAFTVWRSAGSFAQISADNGKISGTLSSTHDISTAIFKTFVYPFELTSFLILIAILGAIVLAHREKS